MNNSCDISLCCGCLCTGRRLLYLNDFWKTQCFLQIISEIPLCHPKGAPIWLCWECDAVVSRFTKFKHQAKYSYRVLHESLKQNKSLTQVQQHTSKLQIRILDAIDISSESDKDLPIDNIKVEEENWDWAESKEGNRLVEEPKIEDGNPELSVQYHSENEKNLSEDEDDLTIDIIKKKRGRPKVLNVDSIKKNGKLRKKRKKSPDVEPLELYSMITLTPDEVDEERRLLSIRPEYENSGIRCERCVMSFPNVDDLRDHVTSKHDMSKPHKCPTCERTFASEVSYKYHLGRHRRRYACAVAACGAKSKPHKCPTCERTFASEVSYKYHLGRHRRRYACAVAACGARAASRRAAARHYGASHAPGAAAACALCHLSFGTVESYDKHTQSHHVLDRDNDTSDPTPAAGDRHAPEAAFPCEYCDKSFKWKTSLNKHAETHRIQAGQKRRPYCEPCRLTFTTTSNLQKHVKTSSKHQIQLKLGKLREADADRDVHIEEIKRDVRSALNKFACAHCGRRFQWRGNLARHVRSHEARARGLLRCAPCARSFSSIATYRQHMSLSRRHVSEEDFKYMCSDCGKKFANKTLLKDHVDWEHLKNYVHKCPDCQKVFKSHTSLYLHKKVVHRRDGGDHLCDHCGKPFPNHAKLRTHIIAMHTSEQPYKCKVCAASFSWHSCLSRHVKVVHQKVKVKRRKKAKDDPADEN